MNDDRISQHPGFWIAVGLGIAFAVWMALVFEHCGGITNGCAINGYKEWQTIIVGSAALGSAIAAYVQQSALRRNQNTARARGKRALLPNALSQILNDVERDVQLLTELRNTPPHEWPVQIVPFNWSAQTLEVVPVISELIEYEEIFQAERESLESLLAAMQVISARRREPGRNWHDHDIVSCMRDQINLYSLCVGLFDYARPVDFKLTFGSEEDRLSAARNLRLWDIGSNPNDWLFRAIAPQLQLRSLTDALKRNVAESQVHEDVKQELLHDINNAEGDREAIQRIRDIFAER